MSKSDLTPFEYKRAIENASFGISKLESYLTLLLERSDDNDEANLISVALDITFNIKESLSHE